MEKLNITTKESLSRTIHSNAQVYQWFSHLLLQPNIKTKLLRLKDVQKLYTQLNTITLKLKILHIALLVILMFIIFLKQFVLLELFCVLIILYPLTKLVANKKNIISQISMILINIDFDKEVFHQKTLYQIGEIYSRKYNVPSIVDSIYLSAHISQHTIITTCVITALIWPIDSWLIYLSIIIFYFGVNAIIKTDTIYKYLR